MEYSVKYKKSNGLFWRKIKGLIGDCIYQAPNGEVLPVRVLFLKDRSRIEIPMTDFILVFSKERFYDIQEQMEAEAGQKISIKTKK